MNNDGNMCKVCHSTSKEIFKTEVLKRHPVRFYQCTKCLFVQTEKEYWLDEAYNSSMNLSDTGVLTRNIQLGLRTSLVLNFLFDKKKSFLDYGGGYGILTRFMRDIGFDFYWYDPYTKNVLARGFEAKRDTKYEAITLFEGFEHFVKPHDDLREIFKLSDTIIFSTTLVPKPTPNPENWWYYGLEHGQHIAFYSKETFEYIAEEYGYDFYTDGKYFHMFTKKKIARLSFKFLTSIFGFLLLPVVFLTNRSKTIKDSEILKR